jgi:hypothetical protein
MSTMLIYACVKTNNVFLVVPASLIGLGLDLIIAYNIAQVLK